MGGLPGLINRTRGFGLGACVGFQPLAGCVELCVQYFAPGQLRSNDTQGKQIPEKSFMGDSIV